MIINKILHHIYICEFPIIRYKSNFQSFEKMHLTLKYCIHCTPMDNWCKNWALMNTKLIMYDNAIFLNVKPNVK
jgi:hypothetical protein